jgi:DivIVA domain-containing protein
MQQAGCDHSLMDRDDPEQRIAELERQLSDAKPAAGATAETNQQRPLTAADIRNVAFSKPPIGKRGYNEDEVDAFLDRVEAWLLNPSDPSLSAAAVQNIAFSKPPLGNRGYNEDEVDAFLARVETEIRRISGAPAPVRVAQSCPPDTQLLLAIDRSTKGPSRRSIGGRLLVFGFLIKMSLGGFRAVDRRLRAWRTSRRH